MQEPGSAAPKVQRVGGGQSPKVQEIRRAPPPEMRGAAPQGNPSVLNGNVKEVKSFAREAEQDADGPVAV